MQWPGLRALPLPFPLLYIVFTMFQSAKNNRRRLMVALLFCAGFAALAPAAPKAGPDRPWYAQRLEALGFTVFKAPLPVQDFALAGLQGGSTRLSALKGKFVLLNFWATWCPPCRAEMPSIEALWRKTKDKPFAIVAVSSGEKAEDVRAFIAKNGYSYPVYLDASGSMSSYFGARSIPTTYLIDKDGKAIAGAVGGLEYGSPEALALFAELAQR
jgi:thiol-disulfide isomerase/thioredoxin